MAVVSGVGHLILDHLRRLTGIFGVDDHLHIGEIGDGVERNALHRIQAGQRQERGREPDQQQVARGPADDSRNHFGCPGSMKVFSAGMQVALGVDQEGRGGDDVLAGLRPSTIST